ncbi:MAG: NFACT family protein [Acutalibacteraceae bacterium]
MPFDGFFARAVAAELQALEGAKVERVNHNAKEYVELCLYLPGAGRRTLVISVCPSDARIALVDGEESRAAVPTMFCMLLRKHLQSARIRSVCALPNERVLAFELEGFDELGHSETKRIYAEIMGKYSNLFLCDGGDRILGALHTTDITAKTCRIFAGALRAPARAGQADALSADRAGFLALARENEGCPPTASC